MTEEKCPEYSKTLWQNQPLEETTMSLETIRKRIDKLEKQVRRRNLVGGFVCLFVMISFAYFLVTFPNALLQVGSALSIGGAALVAFQLILAKTRAKQTGGLPTEPQPSLAFYRSELQRQRDFHQGKRFWSGILVSSLGYFVFLVGLATAFPALARFVVAIGAIYVVLSIVAIQMNRRAARGDQCKLDTLDSVGS